MADIDRLAEVLNDSLTRAEQPAPSRNRPISLYVTVSDSITLTEDSVTLGATTEVMRWYGGSTASGLDFWGAGWWVQP